MSYSYPDFWQRVTLGGTRLCAMRGRGGCDGRLDAHHLIRQQVLRRKAPEEARMDPRVGVALCDRHHTLVTRAMVRLRRDEVPAQAWAFAAQYDLRDELERELAEYHEERAERQRELREALAARQGRRAA